MKVEFYRHNVGEDEIESCVKVLQSLFLTTGSVVDDFESALAEYLGTESVVGLTHCTGALQLSLIAAGVKQGDEVITTPMSFVATSHTICMAGATPVFVDVERETGNIDANLIEQAITKKTKAILPVHLYGQMVDMKKILAIGEKYNLHVIEDAAHALEAERDGIRPGQKSFGACFSFYATKAITSGEGGAFASNSAENAKKIRQLRSHGITSEVAQRNRTGLHTYDIDRLGWKYNMDNIQAGILLTQVGKINAIRQKREDVAQKYIAGFGGNPQIKIPKEYDGIVHGRHIFAIWVNPEKRNKILEYLNTNGVASVINYPAIHLFSYYREKFGFKDGMFPIAEEIGKREITLPMYAKLTDEEIEYVIDTVKKAVSIS
ncbi:spore coat protein [Candidatus Levyibacteriota bacterium]|nr:DegT/DnrJ/EryC1/StrS family aminotransferase [Candidatus Levybacteria bacterium]GDX61824.1 spore coat protein [Candidatus Levybacteria bacterium]